MCINKVCKKSESLKPKRLLVLEQLKEYAESKLVAPEVKIRSRCHW